MMRKLLFCGLFLGAFLALAGSSAQAISIGFEPLTSDVDLGSLFMVELRISGLDDGAAPSLSTFDVDIAFDSAIIGLSGIDMVTFGDPLLGDQLDLSGFGSLTGVAISSGSVNLFELSFDLPEDLDFFQADSFTLASITFSALGVGSTALDLSINVLGDSLGDLLTADTISNGTVRVTSSVPEPSSMFLLGSGLVAFVGTRRWFKK